jgi:hypothetical protein
MSSAIDIIRSKRAHLARFANENGAAGEASVLTDMTHWIPRPKGKALKALLDALSNTGIFIKPSSFDAISLPIGYDLDFSNHQEVTTALPLMCFIEIKSANQPRVKPDFGGFFFALTENEISAAEQLQHRHKVALYNKITNKILLTSVPEIMQRVRSSTWQVSVQL